ncbi:MAG: precorrin-3B synthase [Hyphomicrobiales bacterium]|nr:precorrin-3B synthase [Hyphomicrobiales bacterium]
MSAPDALRRGWCPSMARPMPSGDGLLVRLTPPVGSVPPALLHAIASCARRFGNGLIDLTRRANLQLRGLSEATMPGLIEALSNFKGVGSPHEPASLRDVIMSPLAGLDPKALCDVRPIVRALREKLAGEASLHALPAQFCFTIEDGGDFGLDDVAADIRFKARRASGDIIFSVALGGREGEAKPIGACAPSSVPEIAVALALAYLQLRGASEDAPRRMADLLKRVETETLLLSAGLISRLSHHTDMVKGAASPALREPGRPFFMGYGGEEDPACFGMAVPFGQLTSDQLDEIANESEAFGGEVRLTPWRAIFVANRSARKAIKMSPRLGASGLIMREPDARLNVAACPGKPACVRGTVSPREDALSLGRVAQGLRLSSPGGVVGIHISGCAKGCARSTSTKATLVGRDGRYDLVIDGTAGDAPMRESLTLEEAKIALEELHEEIWAELMRDPHWEKHL